MMMMMMADVTALVHLQRLEYLAA